MVEVPFPVTYENVSFYIKKIIGLDLEDTLDQLEQADITRAWDEVVNAFYFDSLANMDKDSSVEDLPHDQKINLLRAITPYASSEIEATLLALIEKNDLIGLTRLLRLGFKIPPTIIEKVNQTTQAAIYSLLLSHIEKQETEERQDIFPVQYLETHVLFFNTETFINILHMFIASIESLEGV